MRRKTQTRVSDSRKPSDVQQELFKVTQMLQRSNVKLLSHRSFRTAVLMRTGSGAGVTDWLRPATQELQEPGDSIKQQNLHRNKDHHLRRCENLISHLFENLLAFHLLLFCLKGECSFLLIRSSVTSSLLPAFPESSFNSFLCRPPSTSDAYSLLLPSNLQVFTSEGL